MRTLQRRLAWVVIMGAGLALAGCGGSSDGPAPPPAPAGLSYDGGSTVSLHTGVVTVPVTPVVTGTSLTFAVAPSLPAGLSIHATSGILSGTPTASQALSTYLVTASNAGGSTTTNLPLVVDASGTMTCDASTCVDSATNLRWQRARAPLEMNWQDATTYCANLSLGGKTGWRVPNVNNLRTIVQGCPATMTGGSCTVMDPQCLSVMDCFNHCGGCGTDGRGADGRYWEQGIWQGAGTVFWSSSFDGTTWTVGFLHASLDATWPSSTPLNVRCVTTP